jgi:hydroxyacylglutathione hydrolase
MIKINDSIYMIPGQDEMIPDAHMYLIGHPSSHDLSLIDAGLMWKGTQKIKVLTDLGVDLEDIKRIILTHTHLDHIGCVKELIEHIPSIELWVHHIEAQFLEEGDERTVYGMEMFKQMCQVQYRLADGAFKLKVDHHLQDEESLHIGDEVWKVIHIPGHSAGGIALYDDSRGILIPGDVIYADYSIGRFDLHGADGSILLKSLLHLSDLKLTTLLPGHNNILADVPQGYVSKTAAQWAPYLR